MCSGTHFCGGAALTLTFAAIGRVSVVTRHAGLAVGTSGEVTALFAHAAVHARAVAITLACCKRSQEMLWINATVLLENEYEISDLDKLCKSWLQQVLYPYCELYWGGQIMLNKVRLTFHFNDLGKEG